MTLHYEKLWVYLSQSKLLWLTATLAAYIAADWLFQRSRRFPLLNPVLVAIAVLVTILLTTGVKYDTYFQGAQFVHFLLGPATVALAVPLYQQLERLKSVALPLLVALLVGSVAASVSAMGLAVAFGLSKQTVLSLAPKSVTTPIAMAVSQTVGGVSSLTAVLVIITGVTGAVGGLTVLRWLGVREPAVRGFAMGMCSHGIGTARSFEEGPETGAFAGLAIGLNGTLTALLVPLLIHLFGY